MRVGRGFLDRLETKRLWDGRPVPLELRERLVREYERLKMVKRQIEQVEAERGDLVRTSGSPDVEKASSLSHSFNGDSDCLGLASLATPE